MSINKLLAASSLVACLAVGVLSCVDKETLDFDEESFSVSGTVVDSLTDFALDSVAMAIDYADSVVTYTDTSGYYKIVDSDGGSRWIFAVKSGYASRSRLVNLDANPSDVDFYLLPEGE